MGRRIYSGKVVVAEVEGDTMHKTIHAHHYLKFPPALCFDENVLRQAHSAGAIFVHVWDCDADKDYWQRLDVVWAYGFKVRRDHNKDRSRNEQIGLTLGMWRKRQEDLLPDIRQLELFPTSKEHEKKGGC